MHIFEDNVIFHYQWSQKKSITQIEKGCQTRPACISRVMGGGKKGWEAEVKMCAFTWWHTVAGDIGGVGVR